MLLTGSLAIMLVGVLLAAAGLVIERRAGRWPMSKHTLVLLSTVLPLAAVGLGLALIGIAIE